MASITGGTNIGAPVRPFDDRNTYATHVADEGQGGYHIVDTTALRNAIPYSRRELGMLCYCKDTLKTYKLISDPGSGSTSDTDWSDTLPKSTDILMTDSTTVEAAVVAAKANSKSRFIMMHMEVSAVGTSIETRIPFPCVISEITLSVPVGSTLTANTVAVLQQYNTSWVNLNTLTIPSASTSKSITNTGLNFNVAKGDILRFNITALQSDITNLDASISVSLT
jgi:hypothetical protein